MGTRLELHEILCDILGSRHVYFQPPESVRMVYPAIVYSLDSNNVNHADNLPYVQTKRYTITIIDTNPDSVYYDKIVSLPLCSFDRHYTMDNINHFTFTLYF